jgi:pimeloyl-ACP methyl ester carboxylesterase
MLLGMSMRLVRTVDGVNLAYDVFGSGPALVMLHGGAQSSRAWHDAGYVARLRDQFTVVTMDIRGNGESGQPTNVESYDISRMKSDVVAVADAAGLDTFAVCGYSYGGNIARYLATGSVRVKRVVMVGVGFGPAAPGRFRDYALALRDKWMPSIEADRRGALDMNAMSERDRALWASGKVPTTVAQLTAIADWPSVEPGELACPTLWIVGTENADAMKNISEYGERIKGTNVTLRVLPGLTHAEELTRCDDVVPLIVEFVQA